MNHGGARQGAGRKPKPEEQKAKNVTFKLYSWEVQTVRRFIKNMRNRKAAEMKTYTIQDREAGNKIETGLTLEQAEKLLEQYEETDKKEGTYTPNFYEIVED